MKRIISSIIVILIAFSAFTACSTNKSSITAILLDGEPIENFKTDTYEYHVKLEDGITSAPDVTVTYTGDVSPVVTVSSNPDSVAIIELGKLTYKVYFSSDAVDYKETYLQNTYHKLTEEGKLNIGFIGGSVTAGFGASAYENCWAGAAEKWFRDNFPGAEITANNAAFGGIGTDFNAFRAYSELNLAEPEKAPDLLFVECSLNDSHIKTDSETVKGYTEAMLRMVNKYAPECDIVYIFTSDFWRGNKDFEQRLAAMEVLDAYDIKYINVGGPLFDKIIEENGGEMPTDQFSDIMKEYFCDGVHPTDAGYAVYSSVITEWLSETLIAASPLDKSAHGAHTVPDEAQFGNYSTVLSCTEFAQFADLLPNWENRGDCLECCEKTSFTFTFTGTGAYLWTNSFPDGCIYTFVIDGNTSTKRATMSKENENCYLVRVISDIEYGEHTITVNVTGNTFHSRIYGICITGDETHAGAKIIVQ